MAVNQETVEFSIRASETATAIFGRVESSLGRVQASFRSLQSLLVGTVIASFGQQVLAATVQAERASARLDAALKATASSAGLARGELDEMAEALKRNSPFDDDEIRKGIASLLRFRDVQGDIFREAARLAPDLAVALDTDLIGAYTRLGRALEDPEKGLRALREAGLNVTSTQERVAKAMKETGDIAAAQRIILEDLAKSVGGAAAGENTGLYGSIKAVGKAWDDFIKAIGRDEVAISRIQRTLGFVTSGIGLVTPNRPGREVTPGERAEALRGAGQQESARLIAQTQAWVDKEIEKIEKEREEREKRLREEDVRGWVAHAEEIFRLADEENKAIAKIWEEHWDREERLRQEDIKGWIAHAEEVFRLADEENRALAQIADEANNKTRKAAEQLGFTFASAFEDAIVEGEKLRDVLKGLAQDVLRIFVRMTVTQPLAGALAGAFAGAFGAQHGADFTVGGSGGVDSQMVRFWATPGERVVVQTPEQQRAGGGGTYYIDARGADPAGLARLESTIRWLDGSVERRAVAAVADARLRGGAFSRAFG